jgi:hypothetical protein
VAAVNQPLSASVQIGPGGVLRARSDASAAGHTLQFSYTACDTGGRCATANVTVSLTAPVLGALSKTGAAVAGLSLAALVLLGAGFALVTAARQRGRSDGR